MCVWEFWLAELNQYFWDLCVKLLVLVADHVIMILIIIVETESPGEARDDVHQVKMEIYETRIHKITCKSNQMILI